MVNSSEDSSVKKLFEHITDLNILKNKKILKNLLGFGRDGDNTEKKLLKFMTDIKPKIFSIHCILH